MPSTEKKTPTGKRPNSRFKLFIDRDVQGTLARQLCFHWMALGFCLFVLTSVVHILSNSLGGANAQWEDYWQQNGKIFVVLAFVTPVFIWDAIKLSHRFTGPIARLRQGLAQMGDGQQVAKIKFRDGDFWHDIADSFNKARDRLMDAERAMDTAGASDVTEEAKREHETLV